MIKIALTGLVTVICALLVKGGKSEFASFISLAGCLVLFFFCIAKMNLIFDAVKQMQGIMQESSTYVAVLLKIVGITYLAEFASDLCRDAGYSAVGEQVELAGKLTIMTVSLPVLSALLEVIEGFLP